MLWTVGLRVLLAKSMSMSDLGWHMFRIKSVHEHYGHGQSVPVLGPGNLVTLHYNQEQMVV